MLARFLIPCSRAMCPGLPQAMNRSSIPRRSALRQTAHLPAWRAGSFRSSNSQVAASEDREVCSGIGIPRFPFDRSTEQEELEGSIPVDKGEYCLPHMQARTEIEEDDSRGSIDLSSKLKW